MGNRIRWRKCCKNIETKASCFLRQSRPSLNLHFTILDLWQTVAITWTNKSSLTCPIQEFSKETKENGQEMVSSGKESREHEISYDKSRLVPLVPQLALLLSPCHQGTIGNMPSVILTLIRLRFFCSYTEETLISFALIQINSHECLDFFFFWLLILVVESRFHESWRIKLGIQLWIKVGLYICTIKLLEENCMAIFVSLCNLTLNIVFINT